MSRMNYNADEIDFKPLPLGNANLTPFYVDLIGINSKVPMALETKAQALANLLSSSEYETAVFGPDNSGIPQYLMPIRNSVFQNLATDFPIYEKMGIMVGQANPVAFLLDENARTWLEANKSCIKDKTLQLSGEPTPGPKKKN